MLPGPMELVIILVIVAMLFGVGRLPEVFGAVGKGIREFRRETSAPEPTDPPAPSAAKEAEPSAEATSTTAPTA
ncbi:MAG: twin-arginine translocase TatA/TatE family subunit [Caldilinea sp. CFX5]|nr:twin-arginine translocase TatA/TatE family subunit [Caldilinea sp. CFX5]